MITLMMLSLSLIMMFMMISHPVTLTLMIIVQTLLTAMIIGFINWNFWFSYILFLIMIGGMLLLFMYMTNVASNEKFEFSKFISMITLFMVTTIPMSLFMNKISFQELNFEKSWTNAEFFSMFLNNPFNSLFIMIMIYLILTMIMVVKLINKFEGPLRQKY